MISIEDIINQSIELGLKDKLLSKISIDRIYHPHRDLKEAYLDIFKKLMKERGSE